MFGCCVCSGHESETRQRASGVQGWAACRATRAHGSAAWHAKVKAGLTSESAPPSPRALSRAPIPPARHRRLTELTLVGTHARTHALRTHARTPHARTHAPTHSARTHALRTHPRTPQREFASPLNSQADARRAARPPPCIPSDTASPDELRLRIHRRSAPIGSFPPLRAAPPMSAQLGPPLRVRCPRDP